MDQMQDETRPLLAGAQRAGTPCRKVSRTQTIVGTCGPSKWKIEWKREEGMLVTKSGYIPCIRSHFGKTRRMDWRKWNGRISSEALLKMKHEIIKMRDDVFSFGAMVMMYLDGKVSR